MLYELSRSDTGISILQTVGDARVEDCIIKREESWRVRHEHKLARGEPSVLVTVLSHRRIELSEIPTDRTFRDAWETGFSVNLDKVKHITKNKIKDKTKHSRVDSATSIAELKQILSED